MFCGYLENLGTYPGPVLVLGTQILTGTRPNPRKQAGTETRGSPFFTTEATNRGSISSSVGTQNQWVFHKKTQFQLVV